VNTGATFAVASRARSERRYAAGVLRVLIAAAVVVAIAALAVILVGPSRRVRAETGMDDEVETRLLLGLDPEPTGGAPVIALDGDHGREYAPDDIEALEQLDTPSDAPKAS
jgi:hypothetical protein